MAKVIQQNKNLHFGLGQVAAFEITDSKENHTTKKIEEASTAGKIAKWGDSNTYPQEFLTTLKKNGAGGSSYRFLKAAHYGQGFKVVRIDSTDDGKEDKQIVPLRSQPELLQFFRKSKMNRFWVESISDLETFNIAFPEFILSNDFNKIVSIRRQPTPKMRFEKINESTGFIENVYFCHNWKTSTKEDSDYVQKIACVDSYATAEQIKEYCKQKKQHKFIMPIFYPLMDEVYYPEADHHSVYRNGWMDVVNSIPEYKKAFSKNQLNIKFLVKISEEYFLRTYGNDWEKFSTDEKLRIRKSLADDIDNHLSGNQNAGKSIQVTVFKDREGKWVDGIDVKPIETKNDGDGAGLLDASSGNSEIMSAIGVDPNLMGVGIPGGKLNGGSGSDKREAMSIVNALFKSKRETTLEVFNLLRDYNQWPEDLEGFFAVENLTTLDKNPTGSQQEL